MYVVTEGPPDAKIMLVGEAPGKEEDITGKPFKGPAGHTLDNLLAQAGIARYQCLVTNVARVRPPANNISFYFLDKRCTIPKPILVEWIAKLKEEIELYQPNIIVALGSTALWALTGEKKISDFRGYILPCTLVLGKKVLATYHPQAVNYEWKLYFPTVLDLRKALRHSAFPTIPETKQTFIPNAPVKQFITYMEECIAHPEWDKLSVDVETIQPGSHIEELGLSHDPNFGISVFLLKGRSPALPEHDELSLWQTFAKLVSQKKIIMQNGAYDCGVLWYNNHILIENIKMDTLVAAHICWPELPRDLGFLGSICLDVKPWKGSSKSSEYNPADAANTLGISEVLEQEIDRQGVRKTFEFEMSMIEPSLFLQLHGIKVNREKQKELIDLWKIKREELKKELDLRIGREVNFNSSKQMQQLLYIELGLPVQYKRRKSVEDTRTMTTDANALRTLARLVPDNPVFNLIIAYKKADLLVRQFLEIELSPNDTVHTSYNITGASSDDEDDTKKTKRSFGRWSSSASIILPYGSGNLQNIPPEARKMYRAEPGWKIIQADYSQAEAVVVAHLINDQKLIKMFKESYGLSKTEKKLYDIHKMTIASMLGIEIDKVTAEQRTAGKTIRHACVDSETEVLTESGWKKIPEFDKSVDKVAQWDKDLNISFVTPIETVCYKYTGEMFRFKNTSLDQLVSPNHRMPNFYRKSNRLSVNLSEELFESKNGDRTLPISGMINQTGYQSISVDFIKLFAAFQADGSIRERGNKRELSFYIKKERKIIRLRELLTNCSIEWSESLSTDDRTMFYISYQTNKELFDFIRLVNKRWGAWVLHLSRAAMIAAIEETRYWDSSSKGGESWAYYSKEQNSCDWVMTMAHLAGYKAFINEDHPTVFVCNISALDRTYLTKTHRSIENYDGYIYSMQVPSTFYLIRRNGKISVTGNTSYSAGPQVLANRLGIKLSAAKTLIDLYHKANPQLKLWYLQVQEELKRSRTLTNLFGRKHRFLDRWGDSLFRSSYSYIPQSTVGDLLNVALRRIYDQHTTLPFPMILLLQLHDAVYCTVPEEHVTECIKFLRKYMSIPLFYSNQEFIIDVDFKVGDSWAEGEDVEINWRTS